MVESRRITRRNFPLEILSDWALPRPENWTKLVKQPQAKAVELRQCDICGVPMAAGVLVPLFGLTALLNPMIAAAAMSFSSLSVVGNALRLRKVSLR